MCIYARPACPRAHGALSGENCPRREMSKSRRSCPVAATPRSWEPGFWEAIFAKPQEAPRHLPAPPGGTQSLQDLDALCLSMLMSKLTCRELARAQLVCKQWRTTARASTVIRSAFIHQWGLLSLEGAPRSWAVAEYATVRHFVRSVTVHKSDTLAALAVRHASDTGELKRINNMITEHSLHSRTHIYVPVSSAAEITGQHASFVFCPIAGREFILLPPQDQEEEGDQPPQASREASAKAAADAAEKLAKLLGRSLRVDEQTAHFYLDEAGGDIKKAMRLAEQDTAWERSGGAGRHHHHGSGGTQQPSLGRSLLNALRGGSR